MDTEITKNLNISLSPHIHTGRTTRGIMLDVVIALVPALLISIWVFGADALFTICTCVASCVLTEWLINKYMLRRTVTITDCSALITGLLLAFNLPSILPWWMAVIGSVVAVGVGKMSFGGLGTNIWNPALVGRVFLLISFPAAMTTWPTEIASGIDSVSGATASTGATALHYLNHPDVTPNYLGMAVGQMNGSLGEVGAFALLIGLGYLLIKRVVTWHIPVSILASAAFFSWLFGGYPLADLLAGGLMLGACFMATDYVTSPITGKGKLIFGCMIGLITIIIRRWGAYPEGVSFAILLMNSFVPLINRYCRPKRF